jgi:hypothetical protein
MRIRWAGIVASSGHSRTGSPIRCILVSPIRCILVAPSTENDENRVVLQYGMDLDDWIQSYKPHSPNFAVCILHSQLASRGILLKQMEPGIMLKVGGYWQMERPNYEMPESQPVDWLVM